MKRNRDADDVDAEASECALKYTAFQRSPWIIASHNANAHTSEIHANGVWFSLSACIKLADACKHTEVEFHVTYHCAPHHVC